MKTEGRARNGEKHRKREIKTGTEGVREIKTDREDRPREERSRDLFLRLFLLLRSQYIFPRESLMVDHCSEIWGVTFFGFCFFL